MYISAIEILWHAAIRFYLCRRCGQSDSAEVPWPPLVHHEQLHNSPATMRVPSYGQYRVSDCGHSSGSSHYMWPNSSPVHHSLLMKCFQLLCLHHGRVTTQPSFDKIAKNLWWIKRCVLKNTSVHAHTHTRRLAYELPTNGWMLLYWLNSRVLGWFLDTHHIYITGFKLCDCSQVSD